MSKKWTLIVLLTSIFYLVLFWTVSKGTSELLEALSTLFSEALKSRLSINFPGRASLAEPDPRSPPPLTLESAEDLGLDELPVNLGLATPSLEDSATEVPKFGRVLMISQEVDDEYLWLLEPSQVENAWNVLRQDGVNASGWRFVLNGLL